MTILRTIGKTCGFLGYALQYACVTHCTFEYVGDFVMNCGKIFARRCGHGLKLRTHRANEGQRTGFVGLRWFNLDGLANANDRSLACAGDPKRGGNIKEIELFEQTLFGLLPKANE